ncbi:portal protein [Pyramidobacter sp. CG50-2]|uniref:portal protein n=1 Tax=Pyramidobacter sp. CG50-2 TaxID=2382160 RepID=UPI000EA3D3B9|nr:hypothetical protein [Pyramidobacter sp. CG50-2]RKJ78808.1 hypothetical protein D7D26_06110 [Pyramidobacter sp. CG50-2]
MAALKLSAEARERVRMVALRDLARAEDFYRQTTEPLLLRRREIYQADKDLYKRMFPRLGFSDYTSHDFYAWVQWALSQALDSFFGTTKVISIVGQGQGDAENAQVMEELIKWQLEQGNKGFMLFSSWFEDTLVYDLGVLKCWWSRVSQPREETVTVPQDRLMGMAQTPGVELLDVGAPDFYGDCQVTLRRMVTTDNRPVLDHVSPFDMRWLPEARRMEESLFVAQRQIVTGDVLLRGAKEGVYDRDEARRAVDEGGTVDYEMADQVLNPELEMFPAQEDDAARRRVEIFECYVKHDVNGDGVLEDLIVTLANDHLLRVELNPLGRLPFFVLSTQHDSSRVLPQSSMADIEGELQALRIVFVRQILLNISVNNTPRYFIDVNQVDVEDLTKDKMMVRCKGNPRDVVTAFPSAPLAPWTMQLIEYFRSVEEEWTGRTRYNQGTDANTLNKTATGISLIMKSSAQRINHIVKIFAETGVSELNRFLIRLNQTYIDQAQVVRLLDRALTIQPDDLDGNFDIVVNSDVGLGEKEQKVNSLTSYLREVYPFAMQLGIAGPADFSRAAIRLLELLGWKDARTFLRTPEEIQQQQMQQQMMMQQAAPAPMLAAPQVAGNAGVQAGAAAAMQMLQGGVPQGGFGQG